MAGPSGLRENSEKEAAFAAKVKQRLKSNSPMGELRRAGFNLRADW